MQVSWLFDQKRKPCFSWVFEINPWSLQSCCMLCCSGFIWSWIFNRDSVVFLCPWLLFPKPAGFRSPEKGSFYLRSVVPDFLFPARRCLGLRSNTCRSASPFLPWRFMGFWEFFIIFFAFFAIWGTNKRPCWLDCWSLKWPCLQVNLDFCFYNKYWTPVWLGKWKTSKAEDKRGKLKKNKHYFEELKLLFSFSTPDLNISHLITIEGRLMASNLNVKQQYGLVQKNHVCISTLWFICNFSKKKNYRTLSRTPECHSNVCCNKC